MIEPVPAPASSATTMPEPSLWPETLRTMMALNDRSETSMPVPSDSLASLYSIRVSREWLTSMPDLFIRTSLPRTRLSRAWSTSMPAPFERCATLSMNWLPRSGATSRPASSSAGPPLSSIMLRSARLLCDAMPE